MLKSDDHGNVGGDDGDDNDENVKLDMLNSLCPFRVINKVHSRDCK